MAKDREAECCYIVSVAKKKALGTTFLVLARHEKSAEVGRLSETLRRAVGFGWRLGVCRREGVTSQVCSSVHDECDRCISREIGAQFLT